MTYRDTVKADYDINIKIIGRDYKKKVMESHWGIILFL